eukprot:TRINITY_DN2204_c0_g1_i1.p1 TRINITY_DN2204_c0_g1~~TRINITY_DN2204_c0_g1_i1.p1  ORF type:complete len:466 (-),score=75.77 TRINITY_DN2204_c0_g1_i1:81-1478(-)
MNNFFHTSSSVYDHENKESSDVVDCDNLFFQQSPVSDLPSSPINNYVSECMAATNPTALSNGGSNGCKMIVTSQTSIDQQKVCTQKGNVIIHTVQKNYPFTVTLAIDQTSRNVIKPTLPNQFPDFSNLLSLESSLVFDDNSFNAVPTLSHTSEPKLVCFEGELTKSPSGSLLMSCTVKINTLSSKFEKTCFRVKFTSHHKASLGQHPVTLSCVTEPIQVYAKAKGRLKRKRSSEAEEQVDEEIIGSSKKRSKNASQANGKDVKGNNSNLSNNSNIHTKKVLSVKSEKVEEDVQFNAKAINNNNVNSGKSVSNGMDVDKIMAMLTRLEEKQNVILNTITDPNHGPEIQTQFENVFMNMMKLYSRLNDGIGQGSKSAAIRSLVNQTSSNTNDVLCLLRSFEAEASKQGNNNNNSLRTLNTINNLNNSNPLDSTNSPYNFHCITEQEGSTDLFGGYNFDSNSMTFPLY